MLTSYNIVLLASVMMLSSVLLIFFIFWYNNKYILKNKSDFNFIFFGKKDADFKGNYTALNFLFMNLLVVDKLLLLFFKKTIFPNKELAQKRMIKVTMNVYEDNVNVFKKRHRGWLKVNLYLNFFIFVSGLLFFVCYFLIVKKDL